jgi:HTH-type transcriptional regulator/antitoxin HipB
VIVKSVDVAGVVRGRRNALELTQADLADLAEVSERFIRDLEKGRLTIRTDKLLAVLTTLGLELNIRRIQPRK